jgi:hypothetical protein
VTSMASSTGLVKYGCTRGTVFRFESMRPRDVRPVELGCY